jgi:hypothetical protein
MRHCGFLPIIDMICKADLHIYMVLITWSDGRKSYGSRLTGVQINPTRSLGSEMYAQRVVTSTTSFCICYTAYNTCVVVLISISVRHMVSHILRPTPIKDLMSPAVIQCLCRDERVILAKGPEKKRTVDNLWDVVLGKVDG